MPLNPIAKETILSCAKEAIDTLQKSDFGGMSKLSVRLGVLADIYPDDVWSKELVLSSFIIAAVGGSTESEFEELNKEEKDLVIKTYSELIDLFYKGINEGDIKQIEEVLKRFTMVYWKIFGY